MRQFLLRSSRRAAASAASLSGRLSRLGKPRYLSSQAQDAKLDFVDERGLIKFDTLHEMQQRSCKLYANNELFGTFNPSTEKYDFMTFGKFDEKVNQCREALKSLGVEPNRKVAIISNNRWEWAAIATAVHSLSAVIVPLYEAQLSKDLQYIINDAECSVVFCSTKTLYDRVSKEVLPNTPSVREAICLDGDASEGNSFQALMNATSAAEPSSVVAPSAHDLAELMYTSGTTGNPKGVELTHSNFASNIQATWNMAQDPREFVLPGQDRTLAFMPWAHSYAQTCELWMFMSLGGSMGISRGIPMILDDLQLVRPTVLLSVPTLYKKIYDGVNNMIASSSPVKKSLMERALRMGHERALAERNERGSLSLSERMQLGVLDRLVLSKIKDRFGGRLRYGCVAGAACPPEVLEFMDSVGIPIYEGYGLTETSPIIALNAPGHRRIGTVGRPMHGVTVYLVDEDGKPVPDGEEGEICCVGPNVMRGYYKNEEATNEAITLAPDGHSRMFHTGDLGRNIDGYLKVTGRIKDLYKLENGKYVVPTVIEDALSLSRFIAQVVVCGANRPYNVALVVPDWDAIRKELDISPDLSDEQVAADPRVSQLIDAEIGRSCSSLKKFEIPKKFAFVAAFSVDNGMVTTKTSVRRHKVIAAYEDLIDGLYDDEPASQIEDADVAKAA